jgi:dienelactone hydrolase
MHLVAALCLLTALETAPPQPHFEIRPEAALQDEPIAIVVSGLAPGREVAIELRGWGSAPRWMSSATFRADANGAVDLTRMAPMRGDYEGVDAMGLFWSAHRTAAGEGAERGVDASMPAPELWHLTARVDGAIVATATVTRRAVAPDVSITAVHDRGLVGVFYQPSTPGRHPAVLVVSGSGGGVTPASSFPGGLASRGYAVLALAYFGVEGLPSRLHDIPIEYFGTALEWLAAHPSVDPQRIGVLGISRGGELALLLGSMIRTIHAVVAYVPSDMVVGGCCTGRGESSWTVGGRPLAWSFPARQSDFLAAQRAAIPVEKINGAVLLISGRSDRVWPSSEMSGAVLARLERNHFPFPHQHLAYDDAGHGIGRPYVSTAEVNHAVHPLTGRVMTLGGTPAGTAKAREDSWRHVLAFLDENLTSLSPTVAR